MKNPADTNVQLRQRPKTETGTGFQFESPIRCRQVVSSGLKADISSSNWQKPHVCLKNAAETGFRYRFPVCAQAVRLSTAGLSAPTAFRHRPQSSGTSDDAGGPAERTCQVVLPLPFDPGLSASAVGSGLRLGLPAQAPSLAYLNLHTAAMPVPARPITSMAMPSVIH